MRLEVRGDSAHRVLHVDVYQRGWKPNDTHFGKETDADGKYPTPFQLNLGPWSPPPTAIGPAGRSVTPLVPTAALAESEANTDEKLMSVRELVFGLFALSYPSRMRIFVSLKLLEDADTSISESELVKRAVSRARDRNQLTELNTAIEEAKPKE